MPILAEFDPGTVGALVPIVALFVGMVVIVSRHRFEVAKLRVKNGGDSHKLATDVEELRADVKELKEHLHQQMIAVDNLLSNQEKLLAGVKPREDLDDRLHIGNG